MSEQNQDIYYKLGEIHGDIKSTLAEAKRTNGRVTKLETETIPTLNEKLSKEITDVKLKVAYYTGGFTAILWVIEKLISKYG